MLNSPLSFHCSSCGGVNRVVADRLNAHPRCGRCHAALDLSGHPVELSDERLEQLIHTAPVPILVDFWAPWCGPCRMVAPHLEAVGKKYAGRLLIVKINVDQHKIIAGRLGVQGIPTLGIWQHGELKRQESGAKDERGLTAFVQPFL